MELALSTLYLAGLVFFANEQVRVGAYAQTVRQMLYLTLLVLAVFVVVALATSAIDIGLKILLMGVFLGLVGVNVWLVYSENARHTLKRYIPYAGYNPRSAVHDVAIVLATFQLLVLWVNLVDVGGLVGLAENTAQSTPSVNGLLLTAGLYVLIALGGVGFLMRRTPAETLLRLGVRLPTREDIRWGFWVGVGCYAAVFAVNILWQMLVPPELYDAQTVASRQIFALYRQNIGIAVLMAVTAGVGEEILYRGALQPIFGVWLTTAYFTLAHAQYTLTPATLLIFGVAWVFARLRHRQSTTSAIIAHSLYNSIPFMLVMAFGL